MPPVHFPNPNPIWYLHEGFPPQCAVMCSWTCWKGTVDGEVRPGHAQGGEGKRRGAEEDEAGKESEEEEEEE